MDVVVGSGEVSSGWITLTPNEVSTVSFTGNVYGIEVRSRGTASVYFTVDGSEPTVDGRNTYDLMDGIVSVDERNTGDTDTVKLISPGAAEVRVVRA